MRIGFDAKRALNNGSGLGNYSRNLVNALMRDFPDNDYFLFSPKAKDEFFHQLNGNFKIIFPETKFQRSLHSLWRSFGVKPHLYQNRIDIYHGLSNELPFGLSSSVFRLVVTIHDLIFLKHQQQYPFADRQIYGLKTRYAAKHANKIIAVSEETKHDLIGYYGVAENKIVVIPPAVDSSFQIPNPKSQIPNLDLPRKYILNVSSFYPRKNQKTLVEAFSLIKDKVEEDLLLVGDSGNNRKEIEALIHSKGLRQRVKILTGVTNQQLPSVYAGASVFVFPSLYEGFGMPVLEALFSKTPVIASNRGAIQEAGGDAAIYIDPLSADEIAHAVLSVVDDEIRRGEMIKKGWAHAQTMTDKTIASQTMKVYQGLV